MKFRFSGVSKFGDKKRFCPIWYFRHNQSKYVNTLWIGMFSRAIEILLYVGEEGKERYAIAKRLHRMKPKPLTKAEQEHMKEYGGDNRTDS